MRVASNVMNTHIDLEAFRPWMERSESAQETLSPIPAHCLEATLDLDEAKALASLPPLWQWLYFLDRTRSEHLGADGSPRSRSLLPPIPLEQIMWAGSEIEFEAPLALEQPTRKTSRIADLSAKSGARGPMVFLTHEHRYEQQGHTAVIERTRAVFLGPSTGAAPGASTVAAAADRQLDWPMNEAILFRFSALTFNTHRIHYDLPYATEVGGYPGLVVHGPLQAVLIAETFRKWHPGRAVRRMEFRARAPLFCGAPVTVCAAAPAGERFVLWTRTPAGGPAMECTIFAR